jgi:hypothetical protein
VRLQEKDSPGDGRQVVEERARPVEVIQEAAAEHGVERPVVADVARVVADEPQIRELKRSSDVIALFNVRLPALDADDVVAGAGELDRIAALEAAEISDPRSSFMLNRDERVQGSQSRRADPPLPQQRLTRHGPGPIRELDVVCRELHRAVIFPGPPLFARQ